jgi:hypothetical protein
VDEIRAEPQSAAELRRRVQRLAHHAEAAAKRSAVAHEDAAAIQSRAAELFAAHGDAVMAERHRVAAARHVRLAELVHWRIAKLERQHALADPLGPN